MTHNDDSRWWSPAEHEPGSAPTGGGFPEDSPGRHEFHRRYTVRPPVLDYYGEAPQEPATPPAGPGRPRRAGAGLTALLVLVGGLAGAAIGHHYWQSSSANSTALPTVNAGGNAGQLPSGTSSGSTNAAAIASRIDPGLVDINISDNIQNIEGAGTGMVLTSDGEVLTNNHVIEGATQISVTDIGNGRTYAARVVGYDRQSDVAVLQLAGASGLATVPTGNSAGVGVGASVVAVGNAEGRGGTPSYAAGTVTALNQSITASDSADGTSEQLTGLIETNADIVPGDSGGPLVDESGKVVGMDTAASSNFSLGGGGGGFGSGGFGSGGFGGGLGSGSGATQQTQGFSIPISTALSLARRIEGGHSSGSVHVGPTAFLGVEVESPSSAGSGFFGNPYGGGNQGSTSGALIAGVVSGGPAASAGLLPGDVITALGGQTVTSPEDLTNLMLAQHPGAAVPVSFTDSNGNQQTATVRLASGPPQ